MRFILHAKNRDRIIDDVLSIATPELVHTNPPHPHCMNLPAIRILDLHHSVGVIEGRDNILDYLNRDVVKPTKKRGRRPSKKNGGRRLEPIVETAADTEKPVAVKTAAAPKPVVEPAADTEKPVAVETAAAPEPVVEPAADTEKPVAVETAAAPEPVVESPFERSKTAPAVLSVSYDDPITEKNDEMKNEIVPRNPPGEIGRRRPRTSRLTRLQSARRT